MHFLLLFLLLLASFSHRLLLTVFHWSLSDSKSPKVFKTLLSIVADLVNAVVWKVSVRPVIFMSSSPLTKLLESVVNAPIITGITITFIFQNFFSSLARSKYLSLFLLSLIFTQWSTGMAISFFSFFFLGGGGWLSLDLAICQGLGDLFVSQKPENFAKVTMDYLPYLVSITT